MRPNAVHSYWDYARRFLDWRAGIYRPRGARGEGRPVPDEPVSADELERQAAAYAAAIDSAGRRHSTVDTYARHALFFVRWLRDEFHPGGRLRAPARPRYPLREGGRAPELSPAIGAGVDRTLIRASLERSPEERIRAATEAAGNLRTYLEAVEESGAADVPDRSDARPPR
jgi:hypothetical protein